MLMAINEDKSKRVLADDEAAGISTDNDLKSTGGTDYKKYMSPKALKKGYIIWGFGFLCVAVLFSVLFGVYSNKQSVKKEQKESPISSSAVTGDHLRNVPKSYSEIGKFQLDSDKEKEKAKDAAGKYDAKNLKNLENVKPEYRRYAAPVAPGVPAQPGSRATGQTAAEKAAAARAQAEYKAMTSPIRFEIKEGGGSK